MRHGRIRDMLQTIQREVEYTRHLTGRSSIDPRILRAMEEVPRDDFVPRAVKSHAFSNSPLPIGEGQTISQPFIVALMTDLLGPQDGHIVLEVGTGSGYQAAILSRLVGQVYSLEIVPVLAERASLTLKQLGYTNVEVRHGDGHHGWPEKAPFDGIIITAAATHLPQALLDQLKPGGRLVVPLGLPYLHQELMLVEKDSGGAIHTTDVLGVVFVPMTGGPGDTGNAP